jgi:hypothetical protein
MPRYCWRYTDPLRAGAAALRTMLRMNIEELHELARSGDFESALSAVDKVEGTLEDLLEARCIGAWSLSRLGLQKESRDAAMSVLHEATHVLGADHRVTLEAANDAARFAARCGDLLTAVELGTYVYERRAAVLGRGHRKTLTSLANLLRYKASVGETVDFESLHVLTYSWKDVDPQCDDPAHLDAWSLTAELTQDGESAARCVARFEQVLGCEHPNTARAREKLAHLLPPHHLPTVR